jgi:hypothetical protein
MVNPHAAANAAAKASPNFLVTTIVPLARLAQFDKPAWRIASKIPAQTRPFTES